MKIAIQTEGSADCEGILGGVVGSDLRVALSLDEAGGAAGSGGGSHPGGEGAGRPPRPSHQGRQDC